MLQSRVRVPLGTCVWYHIKRGVFLMSSIEALRHVENMLRMA